MVFGINKKLNYYKEENETKLGIKKDWEDIKKPKIIPPKTSSENLWILSFSLVGGILISKYIL